PDRYHRGDGEARRRHRQLDAQARHRAGRERGRPRPDARRLRPGLLTRPYRSTGGESPPLTRPEQRRSLQGWTFNTHASTIRTFRDVDRPAPKPHDDDRRHHYGGDLARPLRQRPPGPAADLAHAAVLRSE